MRAWIWYAVGWTALIVAGPALSAAGPQTETVDQSLCRTIERAAQANDLPVSFFTRLIWRESSFRTGVVSRAGAQGIAQFMPGTAAQRGLADPFDPEQAIPESAKFLAELRRQFGNVGLAAAAYNAGPRRVQGWRERGGALPLETRDYVAAITGRSVDDWAAEGKPQPGAEKPKDQTCLEATALLRVPGRGREGLPEAPFAPWGVQLAGNFSKALALASFSRARSSYASILGEVRPMVIGTRLLTRGSRSFYRVRVPAESRKTADTLCNRIRAVGGACLVLRS